ncbi:dienelactone hydrolase family protein [Marinobacterium sp. YM272]|uniref:dienelactone hydrolase family protein n=1 Tax=Marinobacterium sp. YM272 TaxID=3421654 RepID=UPI003D7FDE41
MILLHGSSGIGGTDSLTDYSRQFLNGLGVATFVIDSFSDRGITQTLTDQSRLGRLQAVYDAYRALELISEHPRIDRDRIGVIGVSRGAASSMFSAISRFEAMYGAKNGARFALHVGFSTPCARQYAGRDETTGSPILILHGEADDIALLDACQKYISQLQQNGVEARLISYPGVHHAFDSPKVPNMVLKTAQNPSKCRVGENDEHRLVNMDTGEPFAWDDSCVTRGFTLGHDASASEASYRELGEFVRRQFGLD